MKNHKKTLLIALALLLQGSSAAAERAPWILLTGKDAAWTRPWTEAARNLRVPVVVEAMWDPSPARAAQRVARHAAGGPVVLIGRGPAAAAVLGLAMDPRHLASAGASRAAVERVVALSGVADTAAAIGRPPPMLVLTAAVDRPGAAEAARRFTRRMRAAGVDARWRLVPGASHDSLVRIHRGHPVYELLLDFVGLAPLEGEARARSRMIDRWQDPPLSHDGLRAFPHLVRRFPVDPRFQSVAAAFYRSALFRLTAWPLRYFEGVPLRDYLEARWPGRNPAFLTLTNRRGEATFWDLAAIEPYEPVIVVGIDDEPNLHTWFSFYRTRSGASWRPDEARRPVSVRFLGAFLYFLKQPPAERVPPLPLRSALYAGGFRTAAGDPLSPLAGAPPAVRAVLTTENHCIHCHRVDRVGGHAHHLNAETGLPQGGYALPLRDYPEAVMERFVRHNEAVARDIGVTPNRIAADRQRLFLDWLGASTRHR